MAFVVGIVDQFQPRPQFVNGATDSAEGVIVVLGDAEDHPGYICPFL